MKLDFTQGRLFSAGNVMSYTESQFVALPASAREAMSKPMMADLATIKALARRVQETGKEAQTKGDATIASLCRQQLEKFGDSLSQPSSLLIVQLVGKAVKKMAAN